MTTTSLAVHLTAFALLFLVRPAAACKCLPVPFPTQYYTNLNAGTPLSLATVDHVYTPDDPNADRWYRLRVKFVYKGCAPSTPFITLARSKRHSAACGVLLQFGRTYLLPIKSDGSTTRLQLCNVNILQTDITPEQQKFLDMRDLCCFGKCRCAGTKRVQCFQAPCDATTKLCPEGSCKDNYCGGCTAEFFNSANLPVCLPW